MHRYRAYTLLEMVLVIALVALVLGAIATLLQSVMRSNRAMQSHRGGMNSILRWASQFRDDVHAGENAVVNAGRLSIQQQEGKTVGYLAANSAIERTVESGGQFMHRDSFDLPPGASAVFAFAPDSNDRLVSSVVTYPLDPVQPDLSDHRRLRIDAALPRSHVRPGSTLPRRSASPTME